MQYHIENWPSNVSLGLWAGVSLETWQRTISNMSSTDFFVWKSWTITINTSTVSNRATVQDLLVAPEGRDADYWLALHNLSKAMSGNAEEFSTQTGGQTPAPYLTSMIRKSWNCNGSLAPCLTFICCAQTSLYCHCRNKIRSYGLNNKASV